MSPSTSMQLTRISNFFPRDRASRRLPHPGEEPQGAPRPRYTHVHCDNVTHTIREYLLYKYIEHTTSTQNRLDSSPSHTVKKQSSF